MDIYNIKYKGRYTGVSQNVAIKYAENVYLADDGKLYEFDNPEKNMYKLISCERIDDNLITQKTERLFVSLLSCYEKNKVLFSKVNKAKEVYDKAKEVYDKNNIRLLNGYSEKITNSMGSLTLQQFKDVFVDSLPDGLKSELNRSFGEYNDNYSVCIYNDNIRFELSMWGPKYFNWRATDFVFEEYDRTLQFSSDYENSKDYKALIKKYSSPLNQINSKKVEHFEGIDIGDKDSLVYYSTYRISIDPSRPLTKKYARQLAKSVSKTRTIDAR